MPILHQALALCDIVHSYFGKDGCARVLNQINLSIAVGEIVSIMGVSGSGKSTLLSIGGLLMSPSQGKVQICGQDVSSFNDKARARFRLENIGFVYQKHFLLRDFNVQENVMMPLVLKDDLNRMHMTQSVEKLLSKFNLSNKSLCMPSQLSGGECQRVAIARALISLPKLILADEPTGNLDVAHSREAFIYLRDIVKEHKLACLIATHDPLIASMTDRTVYLQNATLSL